MLWRPVNLPLEKRHLRARPGWWDLARDDWWEGGKLRGRGRGACFHTRPLAWRRSPPDSVLLRQQAEPPWGTSLVLSFNLWLTAQEGLCWEEHELWGSDGPE